MKSQKRRSEPIDWKLLSSIDVFQLEQLLQSGGKQPHFDEIVNNIAFCSIDDEFDTNSIDSNVIKIFKLSQIIICHLVEECSRLKLIENELNEKSNLLLENKKLRKVLQIHERAMAYNTNGGMTADPIQCPQCPKAYSDVIYLKSHMSRRHPNDALESEGVFALTRRIVGYESLLLGDNKTVDALRQEMNHMKEKLNKTELDLLLEKEERMKLSEQIESDVSERVKQIQDAIIREMMNRHDGISDQVTHFDGQDYQHYPEGDKRVENTSLHSQTKLADMMAIQTNVMIRIKDEVEKLSSHVSGKNISGKNISGKNTSSERKIGEMKSMMNQQENNQLLIDSIVKKKQVEHDVINERGDNIELKRVEMLRQVEMLNLEDKSDSDSNSNTKENEDKMNMKRNALSETEMKIVEKKIVKEMEDKLMSIGIDPQAKGISKDQYLNAKEMLKAEKKLLVEQSRHDYDYIKIEKEIENIVNERVEKKLNDNDDDDDGSLPEIKPRTISRFNVTTKKTEQDFANDEHVGKNDLFPSKNEKDLSETEMMSKEIISREMISREMISREMISREKSLPEIDMNLEKKSSPHSDAINAAQFTLSSQTMSQSLTQSQPQTSPKRPKSALVSALKKKQQSGGNKEQILNKSKRRIRFDDQRIEFQLSPDEEVGESSEDTSEEIDLGHHNYSINTENNLNPFVIQPNIILESPKPKERASVLITGNEVSIKRELEAKDESSDEDEDQLLMNEILSSQSNVSAQFKEEEKEEEKNEMKRAITSHQSVSNSEQNKVHKIAEEIEAQLNKRSASNVKPPAGSVNVLSRNTFVDSDSDFSS